MNKKVYMIGAFLLAVAMMLGMVAASVMKSEGGQQSGGFKPRSFSDANEWGDFKGELVRTTTTGLRNGNVAMRIETENKTYDFILKPHIASALGVFLKDDADKLR